MNTAKEILMELEIKLMNESEKKNDNYRESEDDDQDISTYNIKSTAPTPPTTPTTMSGFYFIPESDLFVF